MHELGVTLELVDLVSERARGRRVSRIRVEIGALAAIDRSSMSFCFEACSKDTPLEGAELVFEAVPGRARCRACGGDVVLARPYGECSCGSMSLDIQAGDGVRILDMEVV